MKNKIFELFSKLENNSNNEVIFYSNNQRQKKTFKELSVDINQLIYKLDFLNNVSAISTIGIIGEISYDWMLCDLACIKGGYKSVALPEFSSSDSLIRIINELNITVLICDEKFKQVFEKIPNLKIFFWGNDNDSNNHICNIPLLKSEIGNRILEEYSITFSSGTSENLKNIALRFSPLNQNKSLISKIKLIQQFINYKLSFWSNKNNKVILFMPFSHSQQRSFVIRALNIKINILLSDSKNCIKHLIMEKPNIMVSVPIIYDVLANRIREKIDKFSTNKKRIYKLYLSLKINKFSYHNPFKKVFENYLFKDIKKIYGGKADYFITGSAPIGLNTLKTFHSIGVKLLEAYGQTETGILSINTFSNYKLGSVGKPGKAIAIDHLTNEILIKYNEQLHSHNRTILNLDSKNEYIHTGDLGYIDSQGFLFITGRKDNVIVMQNGKKIFPEEIEKRLYSNIYIDHSIVFSEDNLSLNLFISLNQIISEKIKQQITDAIYDLNKTLVDYQKIKKVHIDYKALSIENGLLTSTFKPKRKSIINLIKVTDYETLLF